MLTCNGKAQQPPRFGAGIAAFQYSGWNNLLAQPFLNAPVYCTDKVWIPGCISPLLNKFEQPISMIDHFNYEKPALGVGNLDDHCAKKTAPSTIVESSTKPAKPLDTSKILIRDIDDKTKVPTSPDSVKKKHRFVPLAEFTNLKPLPLYPRVKGGMSRACSSFITSKGQLGSNGKALVKYIRKHSAFYTPHSQNITKTCKNWNTMSNKQKEIFWLWTFSALAHDESSCRPRVLVPGMPGRRAAGLFQLEYSNKARSIRPSDCKPPKLSPAQTLSPKGNIRCTVAMMAGFLDDPKKNFLFSKKTYWHHLRNNTNKIKKNLNRNPVCN